MSVDDYVFERRLGRAETIPARWYADPEILARERASVFARTWQLVGRAEQVERPGQFFTATVGDEPVVIVRDREEHLRAFSNVCRHRAGPVAEGAGERRSFRCGYHGWTYALDGRLLGAPEFEGVECWSREETRLPEFRAEAWGPLVFVNLDVKAAPLLDALEDLPSRVGPSFGRPGVRLAARKDWVVECNWKVYVDNYLEGYHIPVVHPSLNRELDYANYRTETRALYSVQHSPIRRAAARLRPADGADEAQFFWLFPNLMLNVYPDNFSTNLIVPLGPERTLTAFEWFMPEPDSAATQRELQRIIPFSDEIQLEDIRVCETVQRNLRSRTYAAGRYSVRRENGVHHFHGLLAEFLGSA
ncbi:MAG TPA: SRPBCC family protein [Pyrinomonadaceae bacterium]|nr:SRPBCC family protein [Pyrinomonadaceae bacterium]